MSRAPLARRCHFASIVFVVRHLGNLGRRKFAVQVVLSREVDDVTVYKVSPGKVMVPTRGFSPEYKEGPARSFIPCTMHRSARGRASRARLHFETLSKLGNCIKSDLYLSALGILACARARRDVANFARLDELQVPTK